MEINKKLLKVSMITSWSFNTTYVPQTLGYTNVHEDQTTCFVNLNFRIDSVVANTNTTLISGLPIPIVRQTFIGMVSSTPVRLYIDEQGNLKTDTANIQTGWASANITYPLK